MDGSFVPGGSGLGMVPVDVIRGRWRSALPVSVVDCVLRWAVALTARF
jgi:hypothetical protein